MSGLFQTHLNWIKGKKEKALNGKFIFKTSETVVCKFCNKEFKCHRSSSSLKNHPFIANYEPSTLAAPSTNFELQEIARPMNQGKCENITNANARWVTENSRPIITLPRKKAYRTLFVSLRRDHSYTLLSSSVISSRLNVGELLVDRCLMTDISALPIISLTETALSLSCTLH